MRKKTLLINYLAGFLGGFTALVLIGAWSYTWDIATPPESESPTYGYLRIQESKAGAQERLNVDHYFPLTGTEVSDVNAGKHRQVTYKAPISTPTLLYSTEATTYTKTVSGKPELHFISFLDGNEVQITNGPYIKTNFAADSIGADLIQLANNTYLKALNAAGSGEISLIKADTNDVPVLPDGAQMATSAAPTQSKEITNKKYVDDQIAANAQVWSPSSYAGEESITLPIGLIIKQGNTSVGTGTTETITFAVAFPHACTNGFATHGDNADRSFDAQVYATSVKTLSVRKQNTTGKIRWIAIGY